MKKQTQKYLDQLQQTLQELAFWQSMPPSAEALSSTEPFAIDHLSATEWLQWIFIPRMTALCESELPLPRNMAISPYIEEALKDHEQLAKLLAPILAIEQLLQGEQRA
ncbi:YqcC family protein [Pasteurellaceae bacterium 22721_9_1]